MTRFGMVLTVLLLALLFSACANPAADKSKAVTSEAVPVAQPSPAGVRYLIRPDTSKIQFIGSKVTGSHNGSFEKFNGEIDFKEQPERSRVSITIDMNSVNTDTPQLTNHLKTPDFFDAARYPQASFVSTEIKSGGEKGASHTVRGNLQLHGVTKSVTFPATISVGPDGVSVESTFSINRKDFQINYAGAADNLIRDEVVLTLHVRGVKAS